MKTGLVAAAVLTVIGACTPIAEPPVRPTASASVGPALNAPPGQPSQYVLRVPARASAGSRFDLANDRIGLLVRGERWIVDARGTPAVIKDEGLQLSRAQEIEKGAGGGFLFIGSSGLYASRSLAFDSDLREVTLGSVSSASVGPGFVLATMDDGRVRVLDLETGKPRTGLPLGTLLVKTADNGNAALITHGGRAFVSRDRAVTWTDVTGDVGTPVGLELSDGRLYILDVSGEATRLDGPNLVRTSPPARPPAPFDPSWTKNETPLELAVNRGTLVDDDRAVVTDAGARSSKSRCGLEKIVARDKGVLPPQGSCTASATSQQLLFLCSTNDTASVFSRPKRGGATKLEKTFESRGVFHRGEGDALLYSAPCKDAAAKAGVACVRKHDGEWSEVDRSAELSDAPANEPLRVVAWIPKEEGAYLVVGGKGGGVWDARSGSKSKLDDAEMGKMESLFTTPSPRTLMDCVAVSADGVVVGLGRDNVGFRLSEGGKKIERSPFRFSSPVSAGRRALARDSASNTLWQSSDWGWSYTEVDGPPDPANTRDDPRDCSDVGCTFNQWIRTGWEARAPVAKTPGKTRSSSVEAAPAKLPQMKCVSTGAVTRKGIGATDQRVGFGAETHKTDETSYLALYPRGFFHGTQGLVEALNLRAVVSGKQPSSDRTLPPSAALSSTRRVRFLSPFDPKGAVQDASIRLSELVDAARSSGTSPPDLDTNDERGQVIGVLSDPPGVLLSGASGPMLWARGKDKPLALSIAEDTPLSPLSAVQTAADELTLLSAGSDGDSLVRVIGRGRANELFSIARVPDGASQPALPDALAIGPDGKLAVIRLTTDTPPTREDPALLLRPREAPTALAPWSTLDVDGSPACSNMVGHRAIVVTRLPWISPGISPDAFRDRPTFMRVRWNATQVCLEAVEVSQGTHDIPDRQSADSYIVAKFGKDGGAGHVMIAEGAELREPRTCELVR